LSSGLKTGRAPRFSSPGNFAGELILGDPGCGCYRPPWETPKRGPRGGGWPVVGRAVTALARLTARDARTESVGQRWDGHGTRRFGGVFADFEGRVSSVRLLHRGGHGCVACVTVMLIFTCRKDRIGAVANSGHVLALVHCNWDLVRGLASRRKGTKSKLSAHDGSTRMN